MAISPIGAGGLTGRRAGEVFVSIRQQLDDLQRQLTTGRKSESYGGLGFQRRTSLDARAKIAQLEGYKSNVQDADTRIKIVNTALTRLDKIGQDFTADISNASFDPAALSGRTSLNTIAEGRFKEAIDLLSQDVNGRQLFSGRSTDISPVETYDRIVNGDSVAGQAGLKQVVDERVRAELGTNGVGRLGLAVASPNVTLTGNNPAIPYGFSLLGGSATGSGNVTANFTAASGGAPDSLALAFTAQPADGDTITLKVRDKDNQDYSFTFTASSTTSGNNPLSFKIGATLGDTINNFVQAFQNKSKSVLAPRATAAASAEFFAGSPSNQPLRVQGTPETSTVLAAGAPGSTLLWYKGDDIGPSARDTAPVRIDSTQTVGTGARANEPAIRNVLAQFGAIAVSTYGNAPIDKEQFTNLGAIARQKLSTSSNQEKISDIVTELSFASVTLQNAVSRHNATEAVLNEAIGKVEDVNSEEVSVSILSLQTRLQASYQVTSTLSKLSLTNFI